MSDWTDVESVVTDLPEVTLGAAHDGESPAYYVGNQQFARLRRNDGREILQFWSADLDAKDALTQSNPEAYFTVHAFTHLATVWAWLDRLDVTELREVLTDSWLARAPGRTVKAHPEVLSSDDG